MQTRTLVHLSDLHIGSSRAQDLMAVNLVRQLVADDVERVVVTGDLTHRGRRSELERFWQIFAPLAHAGRLTVVPGNHDRNGEDAGASLMQGLRVDAEEAAGLFLVRVDSTGPHNRSVIASHGALDEQVIDDVEKALARAPAESVRVLLLHHHVLPLPEESVQERLATWLGWPHARELALGAQLLERVRGAADLVLHGHRHTPRAFHLFAEEARPLAIYNAGSSTELGWARHFRHAGGRLVGEPIWRHVLPPEAAPRRPQLTWGALGPARMPAF